MKRALWALPLAILGCRYDPTAKEPYKKRDLTVEEIRAKLKSSDFKQRLEASAQIDKLDPEEKIQVLLVLADDPVASTRLLAVKKLSPLQDARARAKLERLAKDDPDADVRDLAAQGIK